jgi:hypothetical protein
MIALVGKSWPAAKGGVDLGGVLYAAYDDILLGRADSLWDVS